jgi:hypothetical protein
LDGADNCPLISNTTQVNTDSTEGGDACDDDDDNDGVLDTLETFPLDPSKCGDSDGDTCDDCSATASNNFTAGTNVAIQNDGTDTDSDGICNLGDTDDDNDGFSDADESTCGSNPTLATNKPTDTDLDGLCDNGVDTDDDNDTILDGADNCRLVANTNQLNTDNDAFGNVCDDYDDGDNALDTVDNCVLIANANQLDTDADGFGDVCDNCPNVANHSQTNTDNANDGGDACDTDDDNDGVLDVNELPSGSNCNVNQANECASNVCNTATNPNSCQ